MTQVGEYFFKKKYESKTCLNEDNNKIAKSNE